MKPPITMSTMELRGLLSDVLPFSHPKDDDPAFNCVRLEWTGTELIAQAATRYAVAQLTWTPDEETYDEGQEALIALYKADPYLEPWKVRIGRKDAENIVKAFALQGAKKQFAPIGITVKEQSVSENTYTVRFTREAGGAAWTPLEFTAGARGASRPYSDDLPEGDLHKLIAGQKNIEGYVGGLWWNPKVLGFFGKVRSHGPLEMEFTGDNSPVRWKMGHRFNGIMMPLKHDEKLETEDEPFPFNEDGYIGDQQEESIDE